jgi:hypothetical protein
MPADDAADTAPDPGFRRYGRTTTRSTPGPPPARTQQPWLPPAVRPVGDADRLLTPLARLDARADMAPAALRAGLVARLAFRKAAGWLAANGAWVHPGDLALRAQGLTGRFDTASQLGRGAGSAQEATA